MAYIIIFPFLIGLGILLKLEAFEWAIVALVMSLTYAVEIINTALEATIDAISFEYNIKVKKIKDIAASSTLIITIGSLVCLGFIYVPSFIDFINEFGS